MYTGFTVNTGDVIWVKSYDHVTIRLSIGDFPFVLNRYQTPTRLA